MMRPAKGKGTYSLGGLALIDLVERDYGLFSYVSENIVVCFNLD